MENEATPATAPEVTILLTVYNGEEWIVEAIQSALAQERIEFEILVVDDGSTDRTATVVRELVERHSAVLRLVCLPRSGLSKARNVGFEEARGEFVSVIDADDLMHPLRCWCEVEGLRRHPAAVICFSKRWNFVSGSEDGVYRFRERDIVGRPVRSYVLLDDPITQLIRAGEYPGTSACTSRLSFSRGPGRYDEAQPSFVDGEMWIRAMRDQKAVYCPLPLYLRRVHGASWSQNHPTRLDNVARALQKARMDWPEYSEEQRKALANFEKRATLAAVEAWIRGGHRSRALGTLLRRAWKLRGRRWARAVNSALVPRSAPDQSGWPGVGRRRQPSRDIVPLQEVLDVDVDGLVGASHSDAVERER